MDELVETGKIRFIGVSKFSEREIEQAQATLSKSRIVSNQVQYSLVERTIEYGLLQYCEAKQITVIAFSPLANGPQNIRSYDRKDVLGSVAGATKKTRAQVALNWCVCRTPVITIFKTDKVEHTREDCGASGWRLQPDQVETLNQIPFQRRGPIERFARRLGRRTMQKFGRHI
jgi:diketogulonate reductase-like aldo/keto reductase